MVSGSIDSGLFYKAIVVTLSATQLFSRLVCPCLYSNCTLKLGLEWAMMESQDSSVDFSRSRSLWAMIRTVLLVWWGCNLDGIMRVQLCLFLCRPMNYSPTGFSAHGIFQANTGVGCHCLLPIFLTQGSNPRLLHLRHWQAGSLPLAPPGNYKLDGRERMRTWG